MLRKQTWCSLPAAVTYWLLAVSLRCLFTWVAWTCQVTRQIILEREHVYQHMQMLHGAIKTSVFPAFSVRMLANMRDTSKAVWGLENQQRQHIVPVLSEPYIYFAARLCDTRRGGQFEEDGYWRWHSSPHGACQCLCWHVGLRCTSSPANHRIERDIWQVALKSLPLGNTGSLPGPLKAWAWPASSKQEGEGSAVLALRSLYL